MLSFLIVFKLLNPLLHQFVVKFARLSPFSKTRKFDYNNREEVKWCGLWCPTAMNTTTSGHVIYNERFLLIGVFIKG